VEFDLTNTARSSNFTLESVNIVGRFLSFHEVFGVPALVDRGIDGPEVSKCSAIIRSLEDKIAGSTCDKGFFVDELVDEELDLVKDTNLGRWIFNLEVAVGGSAVSQVNKVLAVN